MKFLGAIAALALLSACATTTSAPEPQWQSIFNGRDLDGWTPKFAKHPLGVNLNNTFRVEDGLLTISYDGWQGQQLDEQFGHLFYRTPYSHYRIRLEYRFFGEQVAGGADWAVRNNGIMVHSQPPETMGIDQSFPDSVEVQLLGRDGVNPRTTANMCSPQTSIVLNGKREVQHCIVSDTQGPLPGEWGRIEVEVQGGRVIRHIVDGHVAMEYSEPMLDEPRAYAPSQMLERGYIALQAESQGTQFRNIEIMVLDE